MMGSGAGSIGDRVRRPGALAARHDHLRDGRPRAPPPTRSRAQYRARL